MLTILIYFKTAVFITFDDKVFVFKPREKYQYDYHLFKQLDKYYIKLLHHCLGRVGVLSLIPNNLNTNFNYKTSQINNRPT